MKLHEQRHKESDQGGSLGTVIPKKIISKESGNNQAKQR